jgi:hypothetical protein
MAMNAASKEIRRLAYISPAAVTISLGGFSWTGGMMEAPPGIADWLRARRMARRRATDCSLGSGWSFEWTSMTKAELTAENRPAYSRCKMIGESGWWGTHENQRSVEVLFVLLDIIGVVLGRLPLVHHVEVEAGVVGLDGLEERFESIVKAMYSKRPTTPARSVSI